MEEEGKEDSDDVDTVIDSAGNFRRCPPNVYGEFACDESTSSASYVGIDAEEYYDEVSPFFHPIDCFFLLALPSVSSIYQIVFIGASSSSLYHCLSKLFLHEEALFDARVFTAGKGGRESGHFDFDNYVVVPVIDGSVYAIDIATGDIKWQTSTGASLLSTHQNDVDPSSSMGSTDDSHANQSEEESDGKTYAAKSVLVPSLDGSLYMYENGENTGRTAHVRSRSG